MKELEEEFIGKGQVKGFRFTQLEQSRNAYLYEVNTGHSIQYEVFYRKENSRFNCVSYPSNKAFGVWAWTYSDFEKATRIFDLMSLERFD